MDAGPHAALHPDAVRRCGRGDTAAAYRRHYYQMRKQELGDFAYAKGMITRLDSQPARIATGTGSEDGLLLFADGLLVAVVSQLRHSVGDELIGRWFLEAGFGPCAYRAPEVFDTAEDAKQWVRGRVEDDAADRGCAAAA
ncbi:hypothetical protein [Methylobacterium sp. ID0610]|uniref:hypothetical protein n=1 Tax=Methylobacterium carpenticola TaxID=3344827 RepID=UPI0036AD4680